MKMSQAMAETSKTMTNMNKLMNPQQVAKTMQEFDVANTKMGMTEEMMNDALDDMLTESGDEEEGDAIVNQVLDEIGIEISDKVMLESIVQRSLKVPYVITNYPCQMHSAPSAAKGTLAAETISKKNKDADDEIERMLAQLKS